MKQYNRLFLCYGKYCFLMPLAESIGFRGMFSCWSFLLKITNSNLDIERVEIVAQYDELIKTLGFRYIFLVIAAMNIAYCNDFHMISQQYY